MSYWWLFFFFLIIPPIIHLFSFRRAKKYFLTTVQFISDLTSQSKSQSRLRYILILVNRCLVFLSIVTVLWLLVSRKDLVSADSIVIYYDNSISSSLGDSYLDLDAFFDEMESESEKRNAIFIDNSERKSLASYLSNDIGSTQKTFFSRGFLDILDSDKESYSSYYLISDCQNLDVQKMYHAFDDTTSNYHIIIPNNLNGFRNVLVDTLYILPSLDDVSNFSIFLNLRTYNYESGNVVVKLLNEGRQVSSIVKDVSELDFIKFDVPKDAYGSYQIELEGDDVTYDNTFYFVIDERSKLKVTVIENRESRFLREVFGNKSLFDLEVYDLNSLRYQELEESDLVVLYDFYEIPSSLLKELEDVNYLVLPADSINIDSYSKFLNLQFENTSSIQSEINFDYNHPLFKGVFEKKIDNRLNPKSIPVFEVEGDYDRIIAYRNRISFLLKRNQIYLLNTTFNDESTFQSNALFVPILYQIAFSISGEITEPYYYPKNRFPIKMMTSDTPIKLKNSTAEYIPEHNVFKNEMIIEVPYELNPGHYQILNGIDTIRSIAINLHRDESAMLAPTYDDFNKAFASKDNVFVSELDESSKSSALMGSVNETSLWKYALILALLLIVTETILHRYPK